MAGFASYQSLVSNVVGGLTDTFAITKTLQAPQGAGAWYSSWLQAGCPAAGSNPASTPGTSYVSATGAITFPDVTPQRRFLTQLALNVVGQPMTLMVYDRLVGIGSIAINASGNKTVNSVALPRYADGTGVQVWLEAPSALSVNVGTLFNLSSYTNQDGVVGRSGATIAPPFATLPAGSMIGPLPLQAGDLGVRSVEVGLNIGGVIPAAGTINVVLIKPLAFLVGISSPNERDQILMTTHFPRIFDGASLGLAFHSFSTAAATYMGTLSTVWG